MPPWLVKSNCVHCASRTVRSEVFFCQALSYSQSNCEVGQDYFGGMCKAVCWYIYSLDQGARGGRHVGSIDRWLPQAVVSIDKWLPTGGGLNRQVAATCSGLNRQVAAICSGLNRQVAAHRRGLNRQVAATGVVSIDRWLPHTVTYSVHCIYTYHHCPLLGLQSCNTYIIPSCQGHKLITGQ